MCIVLRSRRTKSVSINELVRWPTMRRAVGDQLYTGAAYFQVPKGWVKALGGRNDRTVLPLQFQHRRKPRGGILLNAKAYINNGWQLIDGSNLSVREKTNTANLQSRVPEVAHLSGAPAEPSRKFGRHKERKLPYLYAQLITFHTNNQID